MLKQLIAISLSLFFWGVSCEADTLEQMRVDRAYVKADKVEISSTLEELTANEKGSWKFVDLHALNSKDVNKMGLLLDRNSFVEVKVKKMFLKEHACILYRFKDVSKNFAIMLVPSYPVRSAYIYQFRDVKFGVILEKKISESFLAMDTYELLVNLTLNKPHKPRQ